MPTRKRGSSPKKVATKPKRASSPNLPATRPKPTSTAKPVSKPSPQQKPQTPAQPTGQPMKPQGNSLMRDIGTSMVGSMMGVMAADALMSTFGGKGEEAKQIQNMAQNPEQSSSGPCGVQYQSFMKCVDNNEGNVSSCQWAYEMLASCNKSASPQQPQQEKYF